MWSVGHSEGALPARLSLRSLSIVTHRPMSAVLKVRYGCIPLGRHHSDPMGAAAYRVPRPSRSVQSRAAAMQEH
jgi:hypothetical protein